MGFSPQSGLPLRKMGLRQRRPPDRTGRHPPLAEKPFLDFRIPCHATSSPLNTLCLQTFEAFCKVFEHLLQCISVFYTSTGATDEPDF